MRAKHKLLLTLGLFYFAGAFPGPIGTVCFFIGSFFAWETYHILY